MRKFFTLISVALLSITVLNATVVTKTVDWTLEVKVDEVVTANNTFTVDAWASATKWDWMTGADEYEQLVIEVADHAENILVTVNFSDGSADIASTGIMRVGTNSVAVDVTNPILHGIEVKNFSGSADVTISVTSMYLRKTIGAKKTKNLWSGSMYFNDFKPWDSEIILAHDAFADAHIGDILEIYYTLDENNYHQLSVQTSYNHYRPTFLGTLDSYNNYNIEKQANLNKLSFAIMDETDLTKLKEDGGLRINGKFFTATAVKLIKHEVLWTGTQVIGDWSGSTRVEASKLANLKAGETLCIRVSALTEGGQVFLQYDNGDWSNFEPTVNYIFTGSDEAPMVVEIPVTSKMEQQLRGNDLIVQGLNYTMTDIYIPGNNIATYLDVTSAGMATYVLPFDVPTLPDGVKAYRLANNGTDEIIATEVNALEEDKPVLIVAAEGEYEFLSEDGASDNVSIKTGTYTDGALVGTYQTIAAVPATSATNYNYVLQNGTDGVAFYQVKDATCSIAPYHAYLSCGYNALSDAGAPMRIRYVEDTATGINEMEQPCMDAQKRIEDGQLLIIRDGKTYNALGQMVK